MDELAELIAANASLVERHPEALGVISPLARFKVPARGWSSQTFTPKVPGLPTAGPRQLSRPPRVCIATSDLVGPVKNGGVGTACTTLAEALAEAGHEVTILYVGPFEAGTAADWRAHYRDRRISFEVPAALEVPLDGTLHARASYLAYHWLKQQQPFDVIQFPDINGVGFYSLQAKRLGLAFHQTYMCVVLHSPTLWHRTENREHVDREEDLALDFIERESVARADALVSPTNYLLSWASRWGFRFPDEVYVQPNVSHVVARRDDVSSRRVSELVFFGRLESRKGIELFCDALDILQARGALEGTPVTFLGKIGRVGLEDGASYARRRSGQTGLPVRLETALGQKEAIEYLRGRPAVAVMPSLADNMPYTVLECLAEGIPFISTTAGGIPEMVASEDHANVLSAPEPSALAGLIERSLREGASPVRIAWDPDAVRREWIAWHELLAARAIRAPAPSAARPLVSVCIATRNRPKTLQQALDTIRAQTYAPVEVVLVDDASDREDALEALERLEPEFAGRGWQIVRRLVKGLPSGARNTAAAHAHGEYLLFMDDDNLARPHEVESFVAASLHSGVPLLTCLVDHFRDEHGTGGAPTPTMRWLPLGPALTLGMVWNTFGDTNMLVRRDTFLGLGGFDEDAEAAFVEDWIFLTRAALAGVEMAVMPEPLFWYRVWDGAHGQPQSHRASLHRRLVPYLNAESPDRRALTLYTAGLHDRAVTLEALTYDDEARAKAMEARFVRAHQLIAIGPADAAVLAPQQELVVSNAATGIRLRSEGNDPFAWLPVCPPPFVHSIARVELSTPKPTCVQLFWSTRAVPHPSEEQSTMVRFPRGRHVRWAEIPAAAHVGRLRLDPSFEPGDYVLHSFEIRCETGSAARPRGRVSAWIDRFRSRSPRLPLEERFCRGRKVIDFGADGAEFIPLRGVEMQTSTAGIALRCLDEDPQLELPPLTSIGRPMLARLQVTSSIQTTAQVFWATRWRPYCERQSAAVSLSPGRNLGYFAIPGGTRGRLRFDPAMAVGDIIVHALEIRAEI